MIPPLSDVFLPGQKVSAVESDEIWQKVLPTINLDLFAT